MDKIVCFGKNYLEHMHELGDAPVTKPVIFLKPASVLRECREWNKTLEINLTPEETHFECELVIKLKNGGYKLGLTDAENAIGEITVGLDMTLRNKQTSLKKAGHPWTTAKVFPDSAIIGPWVSVKSYDDLLNLPFSFSLDGELRQSATPQEMLFKPAELIAFASEFFPLCAGDILFTGTPAGVGAVNSNSLGQLCLANNKFQIIWK